MKQTMLLWLRIETCNRLLDGTHAENQNLIHSRYADLDELHDEVK